MTPNRRPRLTRRQAEHLLDGSLDRGSGDDPLASMLGAARRPGDPARPAPGEAEALTTFRAASAPRPRSLPLTQPRSSSVPVLSHRTAVVLKLVAAGAAVVAVGGVAAAATGRGDDSKPAAAVTAASLRATPTQAEHPAVAPTGEPGESHSASPSHPAHPAHPSAAKPRQGAAAAPGQAVARTSRLTAACRIWPQWVDRRVRASDPVHGHTGQAPQPAVVAELVRAAGGTAGVASFCARLTGDTPVLLPVVPSRTLPPAPAVPGPAARA